MLVPSFALSVYLSSTDLDALAACLDAFNPARLVLAREASNLEVKDLAARIGTTPSAISQFEHGAAKPKIETLLRLALAVGVPPEFFAAAAPPSLPEAHCHFRRRRGATKREQRYVLARGQLVQEVVHYLADYLEFPAEGISALSRPAMTLDEAEALASAVRDAWGLGFGPISDMVGLLEAYGVIPVEVQGHSERLDAFSVWAGGRPMVFLSTDSRSGSRRRFDAAHELGHLIAHRDCMVGDPGLEDVANRFASAFLLPANPFRAECPTRLSWPMLRTLKRRWGVSLQAIVRRAFDLGVYSEATYRRAYVQIGQYGWRTQEPDEPSFEHPSLIQHGVAQLERHGHAPAKIAETLRHGDRLFSQVVWPNGRAE
ncbi:XRE family transcriptional regulator [Gemmatimonas sp.]|uniref:helix-turn-helix domain-containing protein n=1 Tax=Gemmatimonas sp. TaxID=1962908 RepID=UPI00286DD67D|nr:XRE family transcriptional regulator [Gemmatimonas sp.]